MKTQEDKIKKSAEIAKAYIDRKKYAEAHNYIVSSVDFLPIPAPSYYDLGSYFLEIGKLDLALVNLKNALKVDGNSFEAAHDLGTSLACLGRFQEALSHYETALKINPSNDGLHFNIGFIKDRLGFHELALESYRHSLRLNPENYDARCNEGAILHDLGKYDEAIVAYNLVLERLPNFIKVIVNKAISLMHLGSYHLAHEYFRKALSLDPGYIEASWSYSLLNLLEGNFQYGWQLYESRWIKDAPQIKRHQAIPALEFEAQCTGKTVLVWWEQGLGDTIQFSRYLNVLNQSNTKVLFETQEPLEGLLRQSFINTGIDICSHFSGVHGIDNQIPLLSLPNLLEVDGKRPIRWSVPYLRVSDQQIKEWHTKLNFGAYRFKIGFAFAGNKNHLTDRIRSLSLKKIIKYFSKIQSVDYFIIQKDIGLEDERLVEAHPRFHNLSSYLIDFEKSAAIVESMDLIISVDTSLIHLAGALGKRAFLLTPFHPDWRWQLNSNTSHWYPNLTLFRQENWHSGWDQVLQKVVDVIKREHKLGC